VSKAFTKDDGPDVAPVLRRRAPLPPGTPNYVTARGLRALREELERVGHRPAPSSQAPSAEDAQAHAAWRSELEERVATAVVVAPPPNRSSDRGVVRIGAIVHLLDAGAGGRVVQIVGVDEADAAHGLVAFTAPLARALLGRRAGDVVSVRAPGGDAELEIVAVEWND
jgi:transcription elongation factor GreB